MKYTFHVAPFIFTSPIDPNKQYIGGICEGWQDYADETWQEVKRQWAEWQKNNSYVKLLVDEEPEVFDVPSNSDPTKKYKVTKRGDDWFCECAGFGYRRKCSHIDKIKNKK